LSEEHKRKLLEANRGKVVSEETRRKIGEHHKGKVLSDETRRKISEAKKGKPNQNVAGKFWWNDGTRTIRSKECPGEGWVRGRMKRKHNQNKKLINPNKI
jgi:hypothetical protein